MFRSVHVLLGGVRYHTAPKMNPYWKYKTSAVVFILSNRYNRCAIKATLGETRFKMTATSN